MQPIYLFDLAFQRRNGCRSARRRSRRTSPTRTRRFRARDIEPFDKTLDKTGGDGATNPGHITSRLPGARRGVQKSGAGKSHSGNAVSLEQELMKAGEVTRDYSLNDGIVKAFHRMFMASAKARS